MKQRLPDWNKPVGQSPWVSSPTRLACGSLACFHLSDGSVHQLDRALAMTRFVRNSSLQRGTRIAQMPKRRYHVWLAREGRRKRHGCQNDQCNRHSFDCLHGRRVSRGRTIEVKTTPLVEACFPARE